MSTKISRREMFVILCSSILVLFVAIIPYLFALYFQGDGLVFLGSRFNNNADFPSYLSWIEQVKQGNFFLFDLFSFESQRAVYTNPLFLVTGFVAWILNLPNAVAYYVVKFILGLVYLSLGYSLICKVVNSVSKRYFLFALFSIGSGLGWIYGFPSLDIIQSEATNFLTLYESLINTAAISLILGIFLVFLSTETSLRYRTKTVLLILLTNLLLVVHTYDIVPTMLVMSVFAVYNLVSKRDHSYLYQVFLVSIFLVPGILWVIFVLQNNDPLNIWANFQTAVPAQSIYKYLATFFPVVILALIGFKKSYLNRDKVFFLGFWAITGLFLLFNPFSDRFQQKLSAGIFIPIIILAGLGLIWIINKLTVNQNIFTKYLLAISIAGFFSMTNLRVIADDVLIFYDRPKPLYQSTNLVDSMYWLKQNTLDADRIFSAYEAGNLIPGNTGRKVFIGHYDQTVNFNQKAALTQNLFISTASNKDPLKFFVKQEQINYIFVDEEVRSWGGLDVTNRPYLKLVYENPDVQIYQIQKDLLN